MDRAKAEELLSDMLAGEISTQDLDRLLRYEEENPEFGEYRVDLETAWGLGEGKVGSDSIGIANSISAILDKVLNTISKDKKSNVINLYTLDQLFAAGSGSVISDIDDNTAKE